MSVYKKYGIYGIKNLVNGKIYIGKTMNNFGDRWDCHKAQLRGDYHDRKELQEDWNRYGESNFQFIIIHDCVNGEDLQTVNELEKAEIKKYKTLKLAYNLQDGGDECYFKGKHLSDETKRKIGEKNRINMTGKKATEETKAKMSLSQKKRFVNRTEEEKAAYAKKMSDRLKGIKKPILKEKMKNNKNGAKYTVEQVREIRRLREVENREYTDIASIMNIPRGTVYQIATYARWKEIV